MTNASKKLTVAGGTLGVIGFCIFVVAAGLLANAGFALEALGMSIGIMLIRVAEWVLDDDD